MNRKPERTPRMPLSEGASSASPAFPKRISPVLGSCNAPLRFVNGSLITLTLLAMLGASVLHPFAATTNTLSAQELKQGWILLFDGETMFGWEPRGDAQWEIGAGTIECAADKGTGFLATTSEFADFELSLEFMVDPGANSGIFLRCPAQGPISGITAYEVNISDDHEHWPTGSINEVARIEERPQTDGRWNLYHLKAVGNTLTVTLNGKQAVQAQDDRWSRGTVALQQYNGKGTVRFRNVKLRPLGLKSLFNGKDLTGWKEIPERASVYSVTPEGWLNVKNGNGDLQTEATFADFILQLEIISNGTHLNSGVFFRALPGQFWSGYESQIRNQWEGEDRTQPVDFGTGGIYNHQPARRVVSSDGEWFTKTIVAQGPHLAVWINGCQVSDFTDTRPPKESARDGYRAAPGVISLQGHDPTTDLSFRNLNIVNLPIER